MRHTLTSLLAVFYVATLHAQSLGIGYYDLDGLYDTIPSRFYDDSNYTSKGRYSWSHKRYQRKVEGISAILDSMALPIIGLYGVENESVARDIVNSCNQDYSYIHRTRNSLDGMDFTLLFFGDKLFIDHVTPLRNMLVVHATLSDETTLTIILSRNGDDAIEYLDRNTPNGATIILGSISEEHIDKLGYKNLLKSREKLGEGNFCTTHGWTLKDRIATFNIEKILKSGIFITPWLIDKNNYAPIPTYDKYSYIGGYSRYLPVFTYISHISL